MANIKWCEHPNADDCLANGEWDLMVTYIKHSAVTDFTIYSTENDCLDTNEVFKFGGDNNIDFDGDRAIMIDDDETYIGHGAGDGITTGESNTLIGHDAGNSLTTEDACVMLGYEAGANATTANRLYINNSNSAFPLIYGEFDNDIVKIGNNSDDWGLIFDVNTVGTGKIFGGDDTGDTLTLYGSTADAMPYIRSVGAGSITVRSAASIILNATASVEVYGARLLQAAGGNFTMKCADSNGDIQLQPHGSGKVKFGTYVATPASDSTGYIIMKDDGGTERKIMIQA